MGMSTTVAAIIITTTTISKCIIQTIIDRTILHCHPHRSTTTYIRISINININTSTNLPITKKMVSSRLIPNGMLADKVIMIMVVSLITNTIIQTVVTIVQILVAMGHTSGQGWFAVTSNMAITAILR
jgi:hypothetical protein